MNRWWTRSERRGRGDAILDVDDAPMLLEPEQGHTREFAVAVAGQVERFVQRLRDDAAGQWPLVEELPGPPASPLTPDTHRADAVWFLVRSTVEPFDQVVPRLLLLAELRRATLDVLVPLDVVTDVDAAWLDAHLAGAEAAGPASVQAERLANLAGIGIARMLADRLLDHTLDESFREAAATTLGAVAANTPDGDVVVRALDVALHLSQRGEVARRLGWHLLRSLRPAFDLIAHGARPLPDEAPLALLAGDPGPRTCGAALELLGALPAPRAAGTVDALVALAAEGRRRPTAQSMSVVVLAVACLADAPFEQRIVDLVEELFEESPSPEVRRQAARTLVALVGDEARERWVTLLASTSVDDIAAGERLLRRHGTVDDLPLALTAAHRLLRRGAGDDGPRRHPPRGADLLLFLAEHRGNLEVDALFIEVGARWDRLPTELRAWLREHLPWLGPIV